jgi:hypothetical protein
MARLNVAGIAIVRLVGLLENAAVAGFPEYLSIFIFWAEITFVIKHHLIFKIRARYLRKGLAFKRQNTQIFLKGDDTFCAFKSHIMQLFSYAAFSDRMASTANGGWVGGFGYYYRMAAAKNKDQTLVSSSGSFKKQPAQNPLYKATTFCQSR